MKRTLPERIQKWVILNYPKKYVEAVIQDLIDVAAGNRKGNRFETETVKRLLK